MADASLFVSGIYAIRNEINGKVYVGSAARFSGRFKSHRSCLKLGKHHSQKLQRAWDKYGEANFRFVVLERVAEKIDLIAREQFWIDSLQAVSHGYNVCPTAGSSLGRKASEETKRLMSAQRRNISAETRQKMSESRKGIKISEKVRAMLQQSARTRVRTQTERAKISAFRSAYVGWKHSEETKAKIGRCGAANASSKLNEGAVRSIRAGVADGKSQRSLAREFDVHPQTVCDIISGKNWGHVK